MRQKSIAEVLMEHTDSLLSISGVVGTAEGRRNGEPCIKVLVIEKTPALLRRIPSSLGGYTVAIEEAGEIQALETH